MKILIAEDDELSRDLLRDILRKESSFEVIEAVDGREAWNLLDQGLLPDLCIFDVMMPHLDGIGLLKRIRADDRLKTLKVILCSALNDRTTVIQAAALSINYYIIKPYSMRTVLEQVRKVQKEIDPMGAMEDDTRVCRRLGINKEGYVKLIGRMTERMTAGVKELRVSLGVGDSALAELQVNQLKSAAINLGAARLVGFLSRMETALAASSPDFAAARLELQGLEIENGRLHDALGGPSAVESPSHSMMAETMGGNAIES